MSPLLPILCGLAATLWAGPARAAFEWSGPTGGCDLAGHPARLVGRRGVGWELSHHGRPGLPELATHGVGVAWAGSAGQVRGGLALVGPARHREQDLSLAAGLALPSGLGAAGLGVHVLELEQAGLPRLRRWVPAGELVLTPGIGWSLTAHGRRGAAGLAASQVSVELDRASQEMAVAAALLYRARRPWRLRLTVRHGLSSRWSVVLGTNSAPRQFELALWWSRERLQLGCRLESHADLGPRSHLTLRSGRPDRTPPAP